MSKTFRIVCVDDEVYVLKSLQRLFIDSEFEVLTAVNALDALAVIRESAGIAAVISDYRMPGMNGVELLSEVYRLHPEISRIILSGFADINIVLESINSGHVDKFIPKPWDDDELLAVVREEVSRHSAILLDRHERDFIRQKAKLLTDTNLRLKVSLEAQHAALKLSEARLRQAQLIAHMGDWEWIVGTDEISWSEGMFVIHGVTPKNFQPGCAAYDGLLLPEDRDAFHGELRRFQAETAPFSFSHRVRLADGAIRYMVVRGEAFSSPEGKKILRCTTIDDTERVVMTEELRVFNSELEEMVRQRTLALEQKVSELDAFTSAVSHDLRAPLRHLLGYSEMLAESAGDTLEGANREVLQKLIAKSRLSIEMVDALLSLSRLGREGIQRSELDLSLMAHEILDELSASCPERNISIAIDSDLHADADRNLTRILLTNLLGNAWKYTQRQKSPMITFSGSFSADGQALFCVTDNGAGFDMQYADKLFLPFQRLHSQAEFPGIGIGLATVDRIVKLHNGSLRAEGEQGIGSRFYFTLSNYSDAKPHNFP